MNIFYLHRDPEQCARWMVDSHIVKMVVESAQMLCTAHRVLDGTKYMEGKRLRYYHPNSNLYMASYINHPCNVWVRGHQYHYTWLFNHFMCLLDEYEHRYEKIHSCNRLIASLGTPPKNIRPGRFFDPAPPLAMPDIYKVESPTESYRMYYKTGKAHLHKWTKRPIPLWLGV